MLVVNIETDNKGAYEEQVYSSMGVQYKAVKCAGDLDKIESVAKDAEVILFTATKINKDLLDRLPKVKLFVRYGMGFDTVDLEYTREQGIDVCNAPSYGATAVAEHAFSLMLAANRKIPAYDGNIRSGNFGKGADYNPYTVTGKTLGLVGFGRIARCVRKFAAGFDMRVLVYDPYITDEAAKECGAEKVEFDTLLKEADFISLHVPLSPATQEMFSKDVFDKMKPSAVLVNTARGGLVNEKDMYDALKNRKIRAAGIDVHSDYPKYPEHPALALDNVVLTPHIAWDSVESTAALHKEVTDEVVRFINGEPLWNVVNKKR